MQRKYGALSSSEDPQKLAATVTGVIVSLASLIVLVASNLGFPLNVQQVTSFAGILGTAVGAIWALYGLVRKVVIAIATKFA